MIPLYGFLSGDSLGVLVFAYETDTVEMLADRLRNASSVRVRPFPKGKIIFKGSVLDPKLTLEKINVEPLDRFDLVENGEHGI